MTRTGSPRGGTASIAQDQPPHPTPRGLVLAACAALLLLVAAVLWFLWDGGLEGSGDVTRRPNDGPARHGGADPGVGQEDAAEDTTPTDGNALSSGAKNGPHPAGGDTAAEADGPSDPTTAGAEGGPQPDDAEAMPSTPWPGPGPDWYEITHLHRPVPPGMVRVPGGGVVMGTTVERATELAQGDPTTMTLLAAETPRHRAMARSVFLDRTEVTNLQWKVFLDATGRGPSEVLVEYGWPGGEIPAGQEHFPVTNVNHPEIRAYLEWAGKRLPTEVEWVRAARGDDDRDYPWGPRFHASWAQTGLSFRQEPVAVGSFPDGASPYGLLDMTGNVFEWTDSPFEAHSGFEPLSLERGQQVYRLSPEFDSRKRVIKGGGFNSTREMSRIDVRVGWNPGDSDAVLGFRAARSTERGLDALRRRIASLPPPGSTVRQRDGLKALGLDRHARWGIDHDEWDPEDLVLLGHSHVVCALPDALFSRATGWDGVEGGPQDIWLGVLSTSVPLERPALPPGLYSLEAHHQPRAIEGGPEFEVRFYDVTAAAADPGARPDTTLLAPGRGTWSASRPLQAVPDGAPSHEALRVWRSATGRSLRFRAFLGPALPGRSGVAPSFQFVVTFRRELIDEWH